MIGFLKEYVGKVEANGLHFHGISAAAPAWQSERIYLVVGTFGSVAESDMSTPNSVKLMYNKERTTNLKDTLFVAYVDEAHNKVLPSFLQQVQELRGQTQTDWGTIVCTKRMTTVMCTGM